MPTTKERLAEIVPLDRESRVGRTGIQVGIPSAVVVIGSWVAGLAQVDLDPGPGRDIPANVVVAFIAIFTGLGAWLMNRK